MLAIQLYIRLEPAKELCLTFLVEGFSQNFNEEHFPRTSGAIFLVKYLALIYSQVLSAT